jgi:hypothetical protein
MREDAVKKPLAFSLPWVFEAREYSLGDLSQRTVLLHPESF